ncbi:MAG: hypothetical protein AB7U38_07120 [Hyphomicrobiales bacterium]
MKNIDRWFILMAVIYAILGMCLGFVMGARADYTHVPVHAHMNLVGWVGMAIFGLIYRAWPELQGSPLARLHFLFMAIGAPVMLAGIPLAHSGGSPLIAIAGSVLVIAGTAAFAWLFIKRTA